MIKITVEVEGVSPVMMHRFTEKAKDGVKSGTSSSIKNQVRDPRAEAEAVAYRLSNGELYAPAAWIKTALCKGASFHKVGRRLATQLMRASAYVEPEQISFGVKEFVIDERPVVNPFTKGRQICYRPKISEWRLSFFLIVDETITGFDLVQASLVDAGSKVGIGSFRPDFGRFKVTKFVKGKQ